MRELREELTRLRQTGPVGRAVVVEVRGTAPRPAGAVLLATPDLRFAGSLAGGCVEGASVEEIAAVVRSGVAAVHEHPLLDRIDPAQPVCGGSLRLLLEPAVRDELVDLATSDRGGVLATVLTAGAAMGTAFVVLPDGAVAGPLAPALAGSGSGSGSGCGAVSGSALMPGPAQAQAQAQAQADAKAPGPVATAALAVPPIDDIRAAALAAWADGTSRCTGFAVGSRDGPGAAAYATTARCEVFLEVVPPRPRLVLWGATDVSAAMIRIARTLGWWTAVADARAAFLDAERFRDADLAVRAWPDEAFARIGLDARTAVCIQTHDPKLDEPALAAALRTPAAYVGVMGSRRTQARHRARLVVAGFGESDLARIRGPIGLDLGGHDPAETALAIVAEIVAVRRRGTGRPLVDVRCGNTPYAGPSE